MGTHLVIGAAGQLGVELVLALQEREGVDQVVVADIRMPEHEGVLRSTFLQLDATDGDAVEAVLRSRPIDTVYHLAALLSATGEQRPLRAWDLNMRSLLHVLEAARQGWVKKVFWPSSIAVFGPATPKDAVPQDARLDPTTVYGISKQSGEWWCNYYHARYGVDVRSIRYPGLIGHRSLPGGGTTDYAVEIFKYAASGEPYACFLREGSALPMMFIEDAVEGTLQLMDAPADRIRVRTSYNLGAMTFTPAELAESIRTLRPDFEIAYTPDHRQAIADSWPRSIDDSAAREDWGWKPATDLARLTRIMLEAWTARVAAEPTA
jgi:nucleoside-diphosphate-sugar epimerase